LEWALDHDALSLALGELPNNLSPEEIQQLLADAELSLVEGNPEISDDLIRCGWFLHAVGSAGADTVPWDRRQRAFRVSAHILELAALEGRSEQERLELSFGAMLGYRRGGLDPNATAVFNQSHALLSDSREEPAAWARQVGLEAGIYMLSFRTREAFGWLRARRDEFRELRETTELDSLDGTMFGPGEAIVESCFGLLRFLLFGDRPGMDRARELLSGIFGDGEATATTNERWVAAHLWTYSEEVEATSIWTALPNTVPTAARRALTATSPPVLTLWPPQVELFSTAFAGTSGGLLSPTLKRAVLSIPTSAGKTLVAQILVLSELAREDRSVCFIAPQRSLVREIRRALLPRVRALRKTLNRDLPDFVVGEISEFLEPNDPADVEILTPERFAALLRNDPDDVLNRYSLFIFDEAHLVGDRSRGFTLEGALSYLNWRTQHTDHRILLMSAAIGNEVAFKGWLDTDGTAETFRSTWRGPRRLLAAFTTRVRWDAEEHIVPSRRGSVHRLAYPLDGVISFTIPGAGRRSYSTSEAVGRLVFRRNDDGTRGDRDSSWSSPHYSHVASVALFLESSGPILSVTGTRADAQRLARAIADGTDRTDSTGRSRAAIAAMLDPDHPLVDLLAHGVGFHHAGLPLEVLGLLEDELRAGRLKHLVSTTTLTEGVNLPVHTVILAEMQWAGSEVRLSGPRMLNAIGRAGRAGIETEGWVIFAPSGVAPADPESHLPSPEELTIRSQLGDPEVLEAFAEFERRQHDVADAVFSELASGLHDFAGFVWYVLACEELFRGVLDNETLDDIIASLFVSGSVSEEMLNTLKAFAHDVRDAYDETDPERRRSWARAGTRVSSAKRLDELGERLAAAVAGSEDLASPVVAIDAIDGSGVLADLLALPEVEDNAWTFRVSPRGEYVDVDLAQALKRWIAGEPLSELADALLPMVSDRQWRLEQVVDHVSRGFGHSVSWLISVVLERANARLSASNATELICPSLPLFVRYGVDSVSALALITGPVRNRYVAVSVARAALSEDVADEDVSQWLASVPIGTWGAMFNARPTDIADLLDATSDPDTDTLRRLLQGEAVQFPVSEAIAPQPVLLHMAEDEVVLIEMKALGGESLGLLPSSLQVDVRNVLATGVDLGAQIVESNQLRLQISEPS
jgi:hypothetical protein